MLWGLSTIPTLSGLPPFAAYVCVPVVISYIRSSVPWQAAAREERWGWRAVHSTLGGVDHVETMVLVLVLYNDTVPFSVTEATSGDIKEEEEEDLCLLSC